MSYLDGFHRKILVVAEKPQELVRLDAHHPEHTYIYINTHTHVPVPDVTNQSISIVVDRAAEQGGGRGRRVGGGGGGSKTCGIP